MEATARKGRTRVYGKTMDRHFKTFERAMKAAAKKSPDAKRLMVPLKKFKAQFMVPFYGGR